MTFKRTLLIALAGLGLAVASGAVFYSARTARCRALCASVGPELAWMKGEFQLSDADFDRVRHLHEAYKPLCAEMCRRIDAKNTELARLLSQSTNVTPQIEKTLTEVAQARQQCQTEMLKHFFEVSRAMPPEQGRRYLEWMHSQTLAPSHPTMLPRVGAEAAHGSHEH